MDRYAIYRTVEFMGKFHDSLMCIAYTEEDAHAIVQALRKKTKSQLYYFKKIK